MVETHGLVTTHIRSYAGDEMDTDTVLRLLVTVAGYAAVFAVVGLAFYQIDKRVKLWVARRARCAACGERLDAAAAAAGTTVCPACAKERAARRAVRRRASH